METNNKPVNTEYVELSTQLTTIPVERERERGGGGGEREREGWLILSI